LLKPSAFQTWEYQPRELRPLLSKAVHDLRGLFNEMYRQELELERVRLETAGESYLLTNVLPPQGDVEEVYREVIQHRDMVTREVVAGKSHKKELL
jgi:hypothetical protein